jgi:hypothetical protein
VARLHFKQGVDILPERGAVMKKRHRFFLSPYKDNAFTRCPKCGTKTKLRKFPLVIHIEPRQLFLLNKLCKFCLVCDLIIAKKEEVESLMAERIGSEMPELLGNNYLVLGTLDRKDWMEGHKREILPHELVNRLYVFEDVFTFQMIPAGWYPIS